MTVASIQQALDQAEHHRQAGQWQEADRLCREVLAEIPDHGDAWHLLGIVAFQSGQYVSAVQAMRRAVAAQPDRTHYHCNLGLALAATGQLNEAVASYRHALQLTPGYVDAFNNLGIALKAQGKLDEAIVEYRHALALRPDSPEVWNNLGNTLGAQGDWKSAGEAFSKALSLRADYFEAHNNLGFALQQQKQHDEALACFRRALTLRPDSAITLCNFGNSLLAKLQTDEAIAVFRKAISLQPDMPELYAALAEALLTKEDADAALAACRQALALRPDYVEVLNLLGNALVGREEIDAAEAAFRKALELRPNFVEAQSNLGNALRFKPDFEGALAAHRRALEVRPDVPEAHWNIGVISLLMGDFQTGWAEYEWRKKTQAARGTLPLFDRPLWNGSDLTGKRILLYCEQAFGDSIHFARYVPLVARGGGRVFLPCPPQLARLFRGLDPTIQVPESGAPLPEFDVHCSLPSLPLVMGLPRPEDALWSGPYLKSDAENRQKFADVIDEGKGKLKVGLAWTGRVNPPGRSIPLGKLAPLCGQNMLFYSLQIGQGSEEAKSPPPGMNLIDVTSRISDFADSAALIDQMDLIVSIDTAVAQLAGALGKRVWILLKRVPDWRWLMDRPDSPWYPTAKLFRQEIAGDWEKPIERMAQELKGLS